jgi:hypothetical protein
LTVPVALYPFQRAPDVRVITPERGWEGWLDSVRPLIEQGLREHHLHNPFVWVPESRSGVIMIARTWSAQCWPRKTIVTGSFCQPRAGVWVSRA